MGNKSFSVAAKMPCQKQLTRTIHNPNLHQCVYLLNSNYILIKILQKRKDLKLPQATIFFQTAQNPEFSFFFFLLLLLQVELDPGGNELLESTAQEDEERRALDKRKFLALSRRCKEIEQVCFSLCFLFVSNISHSSIVFPLKCEEMSWI